MRHESDQRRETRRSIRKAAARLYAKNGFADISARKIAESAGVSVGTLYSYFENLTDLMQSLWKEPVSRLINDFEATLAGIEGPDEKLRSLLHAYANFAIQQPGVYRGAFLFVRPESHDAPSKVSLDDDRFFCLFKNTIVEAQSQGLVRQGDPSKLTQTVWAGLHGAIALPINMDRLALSPPEECVQDMIDALLDWLKV